MEKPRLRKVKLLQKVVSETMFLLCAFCCLPVCELWWKFVIIISTKLEFCACWYLLIRGRLWSTNTGWLWYDPGPPHPEIGTIIACNVVRLKYSLFPQTCCVFYALTFNALPGFFFFFLLYWTTSSLPLFLSPRTVRSWQVSDLTCLCIPSASHTWVMHVSFFW